MQEAIDLYPQTAASMADTARSYMAEQRISIKELADRTGISRTAMSQYLGGKYSNPASVEEALAKYFEQTGVQLVETAPTAYHRTEFFESADARRVTAVCGSCQEFAALGIVVGKSGYGKTHTLKHYAKLPRTAYIECDDTMACRDLVEAIERALGIYQTYGTIWRRVNGIRTYIQQNPGYLIIVDEADKLMSKYTSKKMEILRAIIDQSRVGMVISGEPRLESMIRGYLPRLANRVDFYYSLAGLEKAEVQEYLGTLPMDDAAMGEMIHRACNNKTGCFRLLDRTLRNVLRLMGDARATVIDLDMINRASDMMML